MTHFNNFLIAKVLLKPLAFASFVVSILVGAKPATALNSFQQISPTLTTYQEGVDFNVAVNPIVFGNVTASLGNVSNLGCNASDFSSFTSGSIALIVRGTCNFNVKVANAQTAGALGVILYNNAAGVLTPSLNGAAISIPTIGITQSLGQSLLATSNATVQINVAPASVPFEFESATGLVILGAWFGVSKLRNTLAKHN